MTDYDEFFSERKSKLANRWINILRMKASEYEHSARKRGETVGEPSIDNICNEIDAFFTGLIKLERKQKI